jgi:hypothetical protein
VHSPRHTAQQERSCVRPLLICRRSCLILLCCAAVVRLADLLRQPSDQLALPPSPTRSQAGRPAPTPPEGGASGRGLDSHGGCWICASSMPSSSGRLGRMLQGSSISGRSSCTRWSSYSHRIGRQCRQAEESTHRWRWLRITIQNMTNTGETVQSAAINQTAAHKLASSAMHATFICASVNVSRITTVESDLIIHETGLNHSNFWHA